MSPASVKVYGGGGGSSMGGSVGGSMGGSGGGDRVNDSVSSIQQAGIVSAEVKALTRSEISDHDDSDTTHKDIQVYANTLDKLEKQNRNNGNNSAPVTPSFNSQLATRPSQDREEHDIIERYCSSLTQSPALSNNSASLQNASNQSHSEPRLDSVSASHSTPLKSPMQIVMSLEDNQKSELEAMIKDLEDENRNLQSEYQRLQAERDRQEVPAPPLSVSGEREVEMLAEAKLLRQHKNRLESRMTILEDHNKQLEAQLRRLRHLLDQPPESAHQSEFSLPVASSHLTSNNSPLRAKMLPPNYERQHTEAHSSTPSLSSTNYHRAPKLHGSVGEIFQKASQVSKTVSHLVSMASNSTTSSTSSSEEAENVLTAK